jgi:hypothetical protein
MWTGGSSCGRADRHVDGRDVMWTRGTRAATVRAVDGRAESGERKMESGERRIVRFFTKNNIIFEYSLTDSNIP